MIKILSFVRPVVATALVGGAIAACAAGPPQTDAQRASDARTAAAVEDALRSDPRLYARHVDVRVSDGVAHLTGFVWSPNELYYARSDTSKVPGVDRVSDELELKSGGIAGGSPR
jgi:osmotically-inducible protein OsmY